MLVIVTEKDAGGRGRRGLVHSFISGIPLFRVRFDRVLAVSVAVLALLS